MIVAIDTNVLGYAHGIDDTTRQHRALGVLRRIERGRLIVPAQALAELFHVIVRKTGQRQQARQAVRDLEPLCTIAATTAEVISASIELAATRGLQIFDAVILAASASARADLLLSEGMQDGFVWGGLTVVNPFAAMPHPLLTALLGQGGSR